MRPILSRAIWKPTRYRLTEDWIITLDDGLPIVFPRGFETDLASVPGVMWSVPGFAPTGVLLCGGIGHDFFYQYGYWLTPFSKKQYFPESSHALREQFPALFGNLIPVFVGRSKEFADNLLAGITIEATGATFVARSAEMALHMFGHTAWNKYRTHGPGAYNSNSLGLPGLTKKGPIV